MLKKQLGWPAYAFTLFVVGLAVFAVVAAITQDLLKAFLLALAVDGALVGVGFLGCLMIFLAIAVHEGGHAIVARLVGVKVYGFRVGNYEYATLTSGTRWRKVKPKSFVSGSVHLADDRLPGMLSRRVLTVLGGPIATTIVGLFFLLIWRLTSGDRRWDDSEWVFGGHAFSEFLIYLPMYFGGVMLALSADVFLPIKRHNVASDGLQLFWAIAKPKLLRNAVALGMVMVPWQYGMRGRNWNIAALEFIRNDAAEKPWLMTADFFLHYHYLDSGDLKSAMKFIQSSVDLAMQENPTQNLDHIFAAAAFSCAYLRHQPDEARRYLALCKTKESETYTTITRVNVAILVAEGKGDEAQAALDAAIVALEVLGKDGKEDNDMAELEFLRMPIDHPLPEPIRIG
jgi:hypothetical protein